MIDEKIKQATFVEHLTELRSRFRKKIVQDATNWMV